MLSVAIKVCFVREGDLRMPGMQAEEAAPFAGHPKLLPRMIDTGLDFALGTNTTAGVSYSGQLGDGVQDNAIKGRFAWLF